jgi:Domain of unknown function (DUF4276)
LTYISPIVEGYGEVTAVPELIRRIAWERHQTNPEVSNPIRVKATSFRKFDHEFTRSVHLAAEKAKEKAGIVLILLDSEDDCPSEFGPRIKSEAMKVRSDIDFIVCLAYREYETWFMHAAASLAGKSGLSNHLATPINPESVRNAKGWINQEMSQKYRATSHQVALTSAFDLTQASTSQSFQRLLDRLAPYLGLTDKI